MADFQSRYTIRPPVIVTASGQRFALPNQELLGDRIYAYNDSGGDLWKPGSIIITGVSPDNQGSAGNLAAGADANPILIVGDLASDPANFGSRPVLGIATGITEPGKWGELATSGIIPVMCRDLALDAQLAFIGVWVRVSAGLDENGSPGVCESITATNLISSVQGTATPGQIIGQIVVPAGTAAGRTGSNFYVIVRLKFR
jgi:hypothetical protein